jgi:predicted ATP-dependent serine protease
MKVLYVTGEESGAQVALRAHRLGLDGSQVRVQAEIQLEKIIATMEAEQPSFCVIDSIQTVLLRPAHLGPRLGGAGARMRRPPDPRRQGQLAAPSCWWAM